MSVEKIAQEVRRLQDLAGYSDTEMASMLGIGAVQYNRWKNGHVRIRKIYLEKIERICKGRIVV